MGKEEVAGGFAAARVGKVEQPTPPFIPGILVVGEGLDAFHENALVVRAAKQRCDQPLLMKHGADGQSVCIDVAKVFHDFGVPFGEFLPRGGGVRGARGLRIVEDDFRGPVAVADKAAHFGAGAEGIHLHAPDSQGARGEADVRAPGGKEFAQGGLLQFAADRTQALACLTVRCGDQDDVALPLEDDVMEHKQQAGDG